MRAFIARYRHAYGVEPICRVMQLDIGASPSLLGGTRALCARVRASLRAPGFTASVRCAPTARPTMSWFEGIGCETLGQLRRLPRPGLQRRCGRELLDWLCTRQLAVGRGCRAALVPARLVRLSIPGRSIHEGCTIRLEQSIASRSQ